MRCASTDTGRRYRRLPIGNIAHRDFSIIVGFNLFCVETTFLWTNVLVMFLIGV